MNPVLLFPLQSALELEFESLRTLCCQQTLLQSIVWIYATASSGEAEFVMDETNCDSLPNSVLTSTLQLHVVFVTVLMLFDHMVLRSNCHERCKRKYEWSVSEVQFCSYFSTPEL